MPEPWARLHRASERRGSPEFLSLRKISSTHFEKGSHQVPHHVMEEAISPHPIEKQIGLFHPLGSMEAAHIAARIGIAGRKGGEVVLAQNHPGAALHRIDIQPCIQRIDITCLPGRANLSPKDSIFVGFCLCAVPRVKIVR